MIRRRFMNKVGGFNPDNYLTIEALEDGLTASLSTNACQYSTDGVTWTNLSAGTTTPAINTGEKLYFKATGLTPASSAGIGTFTVSKQFNLLGNCMSMLFGDEAEYNLDLTGYNYAFSKLFYACTTLKSVSSGFLPATTLAESCYQYMFRGCTKITTAPELPATTLVYYCYQFMFANCSKLNYIKAMFITTPDSPYTGSWVYGVASTGTFVKNPAATWDVTGSYGVPSRWTIETASS